MEEEEEERSGQVSSITRNPQSQATVPGQFLNSLSVSGHWQSGTVSTSTKLRLVVLSKILSFFRVTSMVSDSMI